ncbi:hypothetical protein GEV33_010546 [Tenebrio molitor]|uniref:Gustatory receptor n=1 Tax=Tenebrio molitor TaxID=7067 RepID=A0A8J6HDU1_TENMO|nr:hypothetical protein GEV33_010546 [Tenebrio molitor]
MTYDKIDNLFILRWSWKSYTFNFVVATILTIWGIWGFIKDMQIAVFMTLGLTSSIDLYIGIFDVNEIILTGFYFVVSLPFKFKHTCAVLDRFNKIDKLILSPPIRHLGLIGLNCFVLIFMTVVYIFDLVMWSEDLWVGLLHDFPYYVLYSVVVIHEMQFWFLVTLARRRVSAINKNIEKTLQKASDVSQQEMSKFVEMHEHVMDVIDGINKSFADTISIILLSCYLHLVVCPYILFVVANNNDGYFLNMVYFLWNFVHISRLLVITEVCHNCEDECGKTRRLIFRLIAHDKVKGLVRKEGKMLINDKLFESLSPLFKTSRVLGLCPGTYRRQHNIHNVLWSRKTYICGVSLTSLLVCWSVWGFVKDMTAASFLTLGFQGSIDFFIASFDFSEVVAAAFYFIVSIPFKARSVCRIVDNFNKIDLLLGDTSVDCVRKRVICFSVFMVVLYVLDLFMWGNNSWEGFNNYCPFYILYCVVIAHQVQYWHLVNLLRRRLYMMNSAIKTKLDWNVPFTSIGSTVQIYDLVCDSVDEINKCFGVSITVRSPHW